MSKRVGYMLVAALAAAALAAYLAVGVLQNSGGAETDAAEIDVVDVAVAARDLAAGRVLEVDDIKLVSWPAGALPSGFSRSPSEVVGRGLLTDVKTNEPLLASRVASTEAGGGLPVLIPMGQRAMSVKVDDVVGVAGFVLPGTRVDVLVTLDQSAGEKVPRTLTLLQNIRVASAGQITERDAQGEARLVPVVTLLVEPAQGEKLALASSKGNIRLALRNSLDMELVETPGILVSRLVTNPPAPRPRSTRSTPPPRVPAPAPVGPTRFEIDVYRGPDRSTKVVQSSEGEEQGEGEGEEEEEEGS